MALRINNSRTFLSGEEIAINKALKLDTTVNQVVAAGANDAAIGMSLSPATAAGQEVSVGVGYGDTYQGIALTTIALGDFLSVGTGGGLTVATAALATLPTDGTRTQVVGRALQAGVENDIIEFEWAPFERI